VARRNRGAPALLPLPFETSSGRASWAGPLRHVGGASPPRVIENPPRTRGERPGRGAETPRPQPENPPRTRGWACPPKFLRRRDARARGETPRLRVVHPGRPWRGVQPATYARTGRLPSLSKPRMGRLILATGASPWTKAIVPSAGAPRATEALRQTPAARRATYNLGSHPPARAQGKKKRPGRVVARRAGKLGAERAADPQPRLISIFLRFSCSSGSFGRVTVRTPFLNSASALSPSTSQGRSMNRWNAP